VRTTEQTEVNVVTIFLLAVMLIGPLVLALLSALRTNANGKQQSTDSESPCRASWALIVNSAVLYALAYNLTFLLQELLLVIPKAIYGLQPILYHNNHRWLVSDPIEDLLQGSGALAVLVSGLLFCWVLSRQSRAQSLLKLFSIWMVYHGLTQSLQQVAFSVLNRNSDVSDALGYLGVGEVLRYSLAIAAVASLVYVGLFLTRPLLGFAPSVLPSAPVSDDC
jgi:hypothetical protein